MKLDNYGKFQPANFNERISALKTINEMQGYKAPTNIKHSGDSENPIEVTTRPKIIFEEK
jgi:hypothetical protein